MLNMTISDVHAAFDTHFRIANRPVLLVVICCSQSDLPEWSDPRGHLIWH